MRIYDRWQAWLTCLALLLLTQAPASRATEYCEVEFPAGEISFADAVVSFTVGSYAVEPYIDPTKALGPPECPCSPIYNCAVSLGNYGVLVLAFVDNALLASGTDADDLWVFEVGSGTEAVDIDVSTDGSAWIPVGRVEAGTQGVDLDAYYASGIQVGVAYYFVRLRDVANNFFQGGFAGADINAVGAISTATSSSCDISVHKAFATDTVAEGDTLAWTLEVHNGGPDAAGQVTLRDPLPPGVGLIEATPSQGSCGYADHCLVCDLGTLGTGEDAQVQVLARLDAATLLNICYAASNTVDMNPTDNADSAVVHVICPTIGLVAPTHNQLKAAAISVAPNPSNGSVTITLDLPKAGLANLAVFDLSGRKVRQLPDAAMAAGPNVLVWDGRRADGSEAPQGRYFLRAEIAGALISRDILIIR